MCGILEGLKTPHSSCIVKLDDTTRDVTMVDPASTIFLKVIKYNKGFRKGKKLVPSSSPP